MESSLAENTTEVVERLKPEITITVTAAIKVPHTYLDNIEISTLLIRSYLEDLAIGGLNGEVVSVDIK